MSPNRTRQTAESGFDSELRSQVPKEDPDSVELTAVGLPAWFQDLAPSITAPEFTQPTASVALIPDKENFRD
jgi:hypothetical protein